jgi:hypothetical protein
MTAEHARDRCAGDLFVGERIRGSEAMRKLSERLSVALRPAQDTMDSRWRRRAIGFSPRGSNLGFLPVGFRWKLVYIEDAFLAVRVVIATRR